MNTIKRKLHYFEFRVDTVSPTGTVYHFTEQLYARSERGARTQIINSYNDHGFKITSITKTLESMRVVALDIDKYIHLINEQENEQNGNH